MKKINLTSIGIITLLLVNLAMTGYLIFDRAHRNWGSGKNFHGNQRGFHGNKHEGKMGFQNKVHYTHPFHEDLNLNEDQKKKFQELREKQKESRKENEKRISELKVKEFELLKEGKLDNVQAEAIAAQYGQYQKEAELSKIQHMMEVDKILTPEQKEKFRSHYSDRKGGYGKHMRERHRRFNN